MVDDEYPFLDVWCSECGAPLTDSDFIPIIGSPVCRACLAVFAEDSEPDSWPVFEDFDLED